MWDILLVIWSALILLLPIAFWMYIFVSFFENKVSRFHFLIGICIWAVMSLPLILNQGSVMSLFLGNIFEPLVSWLSLTHFLELCLYILIFYIFLWVFEILCSSYFQNYQKSFLLRQWRSLIALISVIFISVSAIYLFQNMFWNSNSNVSVSFWMYIYSWLWSIIWYYIIVSLLEEGSKYIGALSYAWKENFQNFTSYILVCACIALGFSFFENIIYARGYYIHSGISLELLQLIFFRSIFSVILHLLSSMIFASAFWYMVHIPFVLNTKNIALFLLFASLWLMSHALFDISLTYNKIGFIIFYIFALYFFLSSLTFKDQK